MVYQWLLWSYVIQWWVENYGEASQLVSILNVKLNLLNPRKRLVKEYLLCRNSIWSVCNEFSFLYFSLSFIRYITLSILAYYMLCAFSLSLQFQSFMIILHFLAHVRRIVNTEHVIVKMMNGDSYVRIKWTSAAYGMLL